MAAQDNWGFVGMEIRPVDNADIFDTIRPLWERREQLNPREKALVYAIAVLNGNLDRLKTRVEILEAAAQAPAQEAQPAPVTQAGGKKRSSKKAGSKKAGSKKAGSKKRGSKKTSKKRSSKRGSRK